MVSSTFDNKIDHEGKILTPDRIKNKYQIFGTSIDHLIANNILDVPDYIKIDVDGIEHLILNGAKDLLKNKKLKEILVELAPDYSTQFNFVEKILENNLKKLFLQTKFLKSSNYKLTKVKQLIQYLEEPHIKISKNILKPQKLPFKIFNKVKIY